MQEIFAKVLFSHLKGSNSTIFILPLPTSFPMEINSKGNYNAIRVNHFLSVVIPSWGIKQVFTKVVSLSENGRKPLAVLITLFPLKCFKYSALEMTLKKTLLAHD